MDEFGFVKVVKKEYGFFESFGVGIWKFGV